MLSVTNTQRNLDPEHHATQDQYGQLDIKTLSLADGVWLQTFLKRNITEDPYAMSTGYLGMTGRKGLTLLTMEDSFALVAAHPNIPNATLIFNPTGSLAARIISTYMTLAGISSAEISRIPVSEIGVLSATLASIRVDWDVKVKEEDVLDWRYPVHTISTSEVVEMSGQRFVDFRKNIHRAERIGLTCRDIIMPNDSNDLFSIINGWSTEASERYGEKEFLEDPYEYVLNNFNAFTPRINGIIVFKDDQPVGFALWQISDRAKGLASSLATVYNLPQKGISEYLYREMCMCLYKDGISEVCIGGSETEGLDNFKRKMNPTRSLPLQTIALDLR